MPEIETRGLTKKYKDITAVSSLDLSVEHGELFSLLGLNGAGKTTTIKMLSCLTAPSNGDALIHGHSVVSERPEVLKHIALSPQENAVAPGLSVRENLELMCGIYSFPKEKRHTKVSEIIEAFGLSDVSKKRAGKLSGGWQRRLSIAMALICEPSVLFLDEPTLGLDVLARAELWSLIRSLKGKITIILTTHYMEEAESLSDRVGIMRAGRLLEVGTPDELMKKTGCGRFDEAFIEIVRRDEK